MEAASDQSIAMSRIAGKFIKAMEGCRDEAKLTTDIIQGMEQTWDFDFDVDRREIGCAIICASNQFSILEDNNHVKYDSLTDYLKSIENGDVLAATATELYTECEKINDVDDDCSRAAKMFACFRIEAKKAGFVPYVDLIKDLLEES
ncbi:general odorant-binding protein 2-like [Cydia fagiglandana]|uniref:general odorant-binding protein 2-like n=1 Tax=Cydia fagiglandana TaxID=1458189 RepID=UPI002FEE5F5F